MRLNLETIAARVRQEIAVRGLQGYDVNGLSDEWEKANGEREPLLVLHDRLKFLPLRPGWPYDEPSDLDPIRQARPAPAGTGGRVCLAGCCPHSPQERHLWRDVGRRDDGRCLHAGRY
jgi:hypothetical protein